MDRCARRRGRDLRTRQGWPEPRSTFPSAGQVLDFSGLAAIMQQSVLYVIPAASDREKGLFSSVTPAFVWAHHRFPRLPNCAVCCPPREALGCIAGRHDRSTARGRRIASCPKPAVVACGHVFDGWDLLRRDRRAGLVNGTTQIFGIFYPVEERFEDGIREAEECV